MHDTIPYPIHIHIQDNGQQWIKFSLYPNGIS